MKRRCFKQEHGKWKIKFKKFALQIHRCDSTDKIREAQKQQTSMADDITRLGYIRSHR